MSVSVNESLVMGLSVIFTIYDSLKPPGPISNSSLFAETKSKHKKPETNIKKLSKSYLFSSFSETRYTRV